MKNFLGKKIPLILCGAFVWTAPLSLSSCSSSNAIQFANFESYMDPTLMEYLQDEYGVQYQWYTVTEMIETKFQRTYDVAVPSGYELAKLQEKGWLEPIDWSKFNIPNITSSDDALTLFADPIQDAIKEMNDMLGLNVLDYGVPYFAQSFTFIYKQRKQDGELIFYENGTTTPTSSPTWADIFYTIGPKNPNLDTRFKKRIGMVDDSKSLFDISRIMQTIEQYPDDKTKWTNEMPSYNRFWELIPVFDAMTSKATGGWYTLNTDSGVISRNLADHSDNSYVAALSWSGDALYASLGAGEFAPYTGNEMHVMKPSGASLDEIEFLVINNKNHSNQTKLDQIYKLIYDICLDSHDATDVLERSEDDSRYKYWSMQNWDTVNYIPTLKSIYDEVKKTDSLYWDGYDLSSRELYTSLVTMTNTDEVKSLFGRPLTSLQNSDIHWAWHQVRGRL